MGNTNMDLLYPEFWAASFDQLHMGEYQFQNLVSRDVETTVANAGTKVQVPIQPDMTAEDWTPGEDIAASDIAQTEIEVSLDKSKKHTINLNGTSLTKSAYDLIEAYGVPMAKSLLISVNQEIYKELLNSTTFIDATAGIDEDNIVDAGTKLSENDVSMMNRVLIGSPAAMGSLMKRDAFQLVNNTGSADVMQQGVIARRMGFDFYANNAIGKYTPADLVGAVDNAAGYSAGDTTMVVDGFDDDENPIRVGDIFSIAGTATNYTVTGTAKTTSDTTAITFFPGLDEAKADDDVITFIATQSLIAMVPSGLAFAARAYAPLPAATGVSQQTINVQGLPVRISVWHDAKLGVNVQYDILFGSKLVKSGRVVRIIEDL